MIIISSNKSSKEFPVYLYIGKFLPIYRWMPDNLLKNERLLRIFFGTNGDEQRKLHKEILQEINMPLVKWSIYAILNWKSTAIPKNIVHIHGTADKLLPYKFVTPDYTIQRGNHMMIMDKANEISALLKKLL